MWQECICGIFQKFTPNAQNRLGFFRERAIYRQGSENILLFLHCTERCLHWASFIRLVLQVWCNFTSQEAAKYVGQYKRDQNLEGSSIPGNAICQRQRFLELYNQTLIFFSHLENDLGKHLQQVIPSVGNFFLRFVILQTIIYHMKIQYTRKHLKVLATLELAQNK